MDDTTDIVEDIFSRVRQILGSRFDGEIAIKLEREENFVRKAWGGSDIYIPKIKRCSRKITKEAAISDVNNGIPVKEVIKNRGISRTEMYRLLKRK